VTADTARVPSRGDLYLVVVKLIELAARASFVLVATYGLKIEQAGQFGLIVTLVGLFAFAFNFERHIDIQRRTAGEPFDVFDRFVTSALGFFAFNWVLMVPLFVTAVLVLVDVAPTLLLLSVVVVIGEHLSNQAYQYALISPRYHPLLLIVAIKNIVLFGSVLYQAFLSDQGVDLVFVMEAWAAGAVACTGALAITWFRFRRAAPRLAPFHFGADILAQHKASAVHFTLGLVAILCLQYDRLAVGVLLPLDQVGLYFRHTLLVSLAYQAFNVTSFNRIMPAIYAEAKTHHAVHVRRLVMLEYRKTVVGTPLLLVGAWMANVLTGGVYAERFQLNFWLIAIMLGGFMLRSAADFHGLILNAYHREADVLRRQTIAFVVGALLLVALTWRFGVYGTAAATVASSALYLLLIQHSLHTVKS
jgi:O-antigen/teichoic acid export membrane protein